MNNRKFRIWDTRSECFLKNTAMFNNKPASVLEINKNKNGSSILIDNYFNDTLSVEWFSGKLSDKQEEIYENDIIQINFGALDKPDNFYEISQPGVVVFDEFSSKFIFGQHSVDTMLSISRTARIIKLGNIHENPELLKQHLREMYDCSKKGHETKELFLPSKNQLPPPYPFF